MSEESKVVIKLPDGLVKGFLSADVLRNEDASPEGVLSVHVKLAEGGERDILIGEAKGIFFVKHFDGKVDHADLRFHDNSRPYGYLWVRLTFLDGEILEGMIENGCSFVLTKGIWITPTDPTGNNILIYASKSHLRHFEVLGMRQKFNRRAM